MENIAPARKHWLGLSLAGLEEFIAAAGQPRYRAAQTWDWLHGKRVADFAAMKNIPAALRGALAAHGDVRRLEERERRDAEDGLTSKWLFAAGDDLVESVLIVEKRRTRRTVCVSSMAGCPLGCVFCATGHGGFSRNLDPGEIVEQVYRLDAFSREAGAGVTHVVFMGMGEPLLNLDAVLAAAARFAGTPGLGVSGRHITISTVGVPEGIRRLAESGVNYRLALSLHAPNQALRERLIPAARRWPLKDVLAATAAFARSASREVTFEYILIDGVNDSAREARELAGVLRGIGGKANLIPLNPVAGFSGRAPAAGKVAAFRDLLEERGVPVTVRVEKGREIGAACGQLRADAVEGATRGRERNKGGREAAS